MSEGDSLIDAKSSLVSWSSDLPRFEELSNLDVRFRGYESLDVTLEVLKSKKKYVILFSGVLGYRFENAFSSVRLTNTFKVLNSPWIASMQLKPFRSRPIDTAQHYLISSDAGELEIVSLAEPTIEVEDDAAGNQNENAESAIIADLAKGACERISRKVIRSLTKMTDEMQLGDDTSLKNVWDEICVQVQGQESTMWDAYLDTIQSMTLREVAKLDMATRQAIWLQTEEGIDWRFDKGKSEGQGVPNDSEDMARYVVNEFVLSSAADWTNGRIEKFLQNEM